MCKKQKTKNNMSTSSIYVPNSWKRFREGLLTKQKLKKFAKHCVFGILTMLTH